MYLIVTMKQLGKVKKRERNKLRDHILLQTDRSRRLPLKDTGPDQVGGDDVTSQLIIACTY